MTPKLDSNFFRHNRASFLKQVQSKVVVVAANHKMQRSGDSQYPFRQDSYFWYLTGLDTAGALLVMSGQESFIIAPHQSKFDVIAEGSTDLTALAARAGVEEALSYQAGWRRLAKLISNQKRLGVLGVPSGLERHVSLNNARLKLQQKLRRLKSSLQWEDVRPALVAMRMIKQPQELAIIEQAVAITCQAFAELTPKQLQTLQYEYEVEAQLTAHFRRHGTTHAYTPIVASGQNACAIHYTANDDRLQKKQLLLVDMGAELSNYASDITRTFSIAAPTARQQEVIMAVAEVQAYAYTLIKPGVKRRDYELAVEAYMGDVLIKLGLIQRKTRKHIRRYYPHATSHYMGLDVHDVADYTQPLAENMVLTVEPGIYIPEENIGVRIEDDIVVTKKGYRNLSHQLPVVLS